MSPRWNPNPEVGTGRHAVSNLHAHLVFVTRYRRSALTGAMLTRTEDHARGLHYPPKVQLSKLVNSLKGVSSRRLRQEYDAHVHRYLWGGHFWSACYFGGFCGGAPLTVVKQYIENQQRPAD
ncbi:IS200/IS605 family transposase [Streptomyces sp. V4I2]|uniref:IS200/IS605 family transposase n=1 Tax=Streptomyces sp. V4I2 TaxID=3042280 RepID=UPI002788118D|nr:IS200/IS605 family transposase [Streptomyces sp. V4I2]MDQ1043210.1 putative transposase [Streptomyces sp. V4I2]